MLFRSAVQETLKSLLQHHSSKASILQRSAFFTVQLSHLYMTTGKTIALTRRTFVGKVMSLLFNMLSRLVIAFPPKSKCLLISWLQSPSAVILKVLVAQSCLTLCNPLAVALQAPLSMGFPRQESWSGLPFSSPGDLPNFIFTFHFHASVPAFPDDASSCGAGLHASLLTWL